MWVGGVEEEDEVWGGDVVAEQFGESVIEVHFVVVEGLFGEEAIFVEEVVRDGKGFKQIFLQEIDLLLVSTCEVEHLCRKSIMFGVRIKAGEERIGFTGLEDEFCLVPLFHESAQTRFSDADKAFHYDIF